MIETKNGSPKEEMPSYVKELPQKSFKENKNFLRLTTLDRNLKSVPYVALGLIISKFMCMPFTYMKGDESRYNHLFKIVSFIFQTVIHSGFAHILRHRV